MHIIEIILIPVYLFILSLYFKWRRKKLPNDILKKYHRQGFWIKMTASILFALYYTYLTGGDTRSLYYPEGNNLFHLLLKDSSNWKYLFIKGANFDPQLLANEYAIGYIKEESNFIVIKITALLGFLTFGYFTIISLFFACFAFSGLWKLFMFFYEQRPAMHKAFAISILFFPSVVFWSSGIMKDSLCIGALGWLTYSLYQFIKRRKVLANGTIVFISVYILSITKVYILLAYAPFFLLFLLIKKLGNVQITFFKYLLTLGIIAGITFIFSQTYDSYEDELGAYAIENLTSSISALNEVILVRSGDEGAESNFNLGAEFNGTFPGMIKIAPYALTATFFRPFIWETRKISQLMAAAESIILIFFTLQIFFNVGPFKFIKYILSDPLIMFCMLFALIFGLFVGASTLNFGTLVRYKIPCMPFYTIGLFLIYEKVKEAKKAKQNLIHSEIHSILLPAI